MSERLNKIIERVNILGKNPELEIEKPSLLENSGAVSLFEEMRDTGFLKWSDIASAQIKANENEVSIEFDATPDCECSLIKVRTTENNTLEFIECEGLFKKTIKPIDNNLNGLIARAIVNSKNRCKTVINEVEKTDREIRNN